MTPKRYLAFACITLLLQGGLIAAQDHAPLDIDNFQMNSGSAMGQTQAINLAIAMRSNVEARQTSQQKTQTKPAIAKVRPATPISKRSVDEGIKPTETVIAKQTPPEPKPAEPKSKPAKSKSVSAKNESLVQPKELTKEPTKDADLDPRLTTRSDALIRSHNQLKVTAKQGVSREAMTLNRPVFSSPPIQPKYPKLARKRGFEGTTTLEVMFNQIGEQLSLTLIDSSGFSLLDKAAISAVELWQFSPPSPQTALAYTVKVPIKFSLN